MNIYWREEKEENEKRKKNKQKKKKEKKTKMYSHCGLANQPTRATNQTAAMVMVVASQPHQAISRDLGPLIYNGVVLQYIFYYISLPVANENE